MVIFVGIDIIGFFIVLGTLLVFIVHYGVSAILTWLLQYYIPIMIASGIIATIVCGVIAYFKAENNKAKNIVSEILLAPCPIMLATSEVFGAFGKITTESILMLILFTGPIIIISTLIIIALELIVGCVIPYFLINTIKNNPNVKIVISLIIFIVEVIAIYQFGIFERPHI